MIQLPIKNIIAFIKDHRFSNDEVDEYLNKVFKTYTKELCDKQKEIIYNMFLEDNIYESKDIRDKISATDNIIDIESDLLIQELRHEIKSNKLDASKLDNDNLNEE